jgi:hypothetical protein
MGDSLGLQSAKEPTRPVLDHWVSDSNHLNILQVEPDSVLRGKSAIGLRRSGKSLYVCQHTDSLTGKVYVRYDLASLAQHWFEIIELPRQE